MAGLGDLIHGIYALGFAGILGVIMLTVMGSLSATGQAATFLNNTSTGMTNLAAQLPLVGTVIALGVVIVVVIGAFAFFQGAGGVQR